MIQLIYVSSARNLAPNAIDDILTRSRINNRRDDISGLLYFDGVRFLQALEGPDDKVEATYARIQRDPRHRATVVLSRRTVPIREFGPWAMAHRVAGDDADGAIARMTKLLERVSPAVRGTFEGLAKVRRAG